MLQQHPSVLSLAHLNCNSSPHDHEGEQHHATHPAQVYGLQDEEPRPTQLLGRVRGVTHAVHPLHLQLFDEASALVAQLVKAELAVVAAHPTVSCTRQHIFKDCHETHVHMYIRCSVHMAQLQR